MKRLLFPVFILLSFFSTGQTYVGFPDSDALWHERFVWVSQNMDNHYQYGIVGDTTLHLKLYHKLYRQQNCLLDTSLTNQNSILIGAIREDSLKKVYFYSMGYEFTQHDSIYLLYDFSKQPGDTIHFNTQGISPFPYLILNSIDSIWAFDRYRKRYHLNGDTWIEGIGSITNLLYNITPIPLCGCNDQLMCYKNKNNTYYLAPALNDCYDFTTGIDGANNTGSAIKIYPNPISTSGTIDFTGISTPMTGLEIFNILGKKIREYPIPESKKVLIDRNEFSSGLYIYRLTAADHQCLNGKFLIE